MASPSTEMTIPRAPTNTVMPLDTAQVLDPVYTIGEAATLRKDILDFTQGVMMKDIDYGVIPGTDKPTLLKPGAEKLCTFFGLSPSFRILERINDWTGKDTNGEPLHSYEIECTLYRLGVPVGQGIGLCSTFEKKYRVRDAKPVCPSCKGMFINKSRPDPKRGKYDDGWYCWRKIGGCGDTFDKDDDRITSQTVGTIPNPDVSDLANTVLKMAQKRALVAAVLIACNASAHFTQDVEDQQKWIQPIVPPPQPATPQEAAFRLYTRYGGMLGGTSWKHIQRLLALDPDEDQPETVEDWLAIGRRLKRASEQIVIDGTIS